MSRSNEAQNISANSISDDTDDLPTLQLGNFWIIPNNLGIVIKFTELDVFIPLIDKLLNEQKSE
jgi:hypothetical protein